MRRAVWMMVGIWIGTSACADSEKPSIPLDAGVQLLDPNSGKDAGRGDTAASNPDLPEPEPGAPPCDGLEPNDHPDSATPITVDRVEISSLLCASDEDWFTIALSPGDRLSVTLDIDRGGGDLDAIVYGPDLEEIARSETTTSRESIELTAETGGPHYVQLYGFETARGSYTLTIHRQPGDPPCLDDTLEENDTLAAATQLLPPESFNATLCGGDDDVYTLELVAGEVFRAALEFEHAEGDLDMHLIGPNNQTLAEGATSDDDESIRHEVITTGIYALRVLGYGGAEAPYRLDVAVGFDAPPAPHLASGQVRFDDPFLDRGVYDYARRPLAGAVVEVVDEDSGAVLGQGSTDGSGRYRIRFDGADHPQVYTRVLARRRGPESSVDIVTAGRRVYAVRSFETLSPAASMVLDLDLTQTEQLAAPFNTLDAINRGLIWWSASFEVRGMPPLHVVWEDGQQFECGTCYRHEDAPSTIYLYGFPTDNDALDDPVILHELGHFIQNHFSVEDSPGGSHDGTPIDPRLAWAEGWATAFSSMVREDPIYYDTRGAGIVWHDLESPEEAVAVFTGASVGAPISEYFVAAVLWDIFDTAEDEHDRVNAGGAAIHPVIDYLDVGQRGRRGAEGVDLFDYLDGAHCLDIAPSSSLNALIDGFEYPYSGPPEDCKTENPVTITFPTPSSLQISPRRPLTSLEVLACDPTGCALLFEGDGAPVEIDLDGLHAHWIEVRMHSGTWQWTEAIPLTSPPKTISRWLPTTPTLDGAPVVLGRARR